METQHNIRLTSVELTSLWQTYINDSMSVCVFTYFLEHVEDTEIRSIIEYAIKDAMDHVEFVKNVFTEEKIPIPIGFKDDDVNRNAPRLYQDTFYLYYIKIMTKGALPLYAALFPNIIKKEIREFYSNCLVTTTNLHNKAIDLLVDKGLASRPPYIPYDREVEYIKKQSFLAGWFGEQRPLTGFEITHLYSNIQTATLVKALTLGFEQITISDQVRKYMRRGKEIAQKHIDLFTKPLSKADLPIPMTWEQTVTTSTSTPFSEKLLMYHIDMLSSVGIGNYGVSLSATPRRDIALSYSRILTEIGQYAEDGFNIMIENEWMERPPHATDRDQLLKQKEQSTR